jgi:hypothetical protein
MRLGSDRCDCAQNDGREMGEFVGLVIGDCVLGLVGEAVVEEFVAGFVASLDLEE